MRAAFPWGGDFLPPRPQYAGGAPRRVDMPAAAIITTIIDLRTGKRETSIERPTAAPRPIPVRLPPRPKPEWTPHGRPVRAKPKPPCLQCGAKIGRSRHKFCSTKCTGEYSRAQALKLDDARTPATRAPRNATGVIVWACAAAWAIEENRILSRERTWRAVAPRDAAILLMSKLLKLSQAGIGRIFKHADHTSARSAIPRALRRMQDDADWARRYEIARARCVEHLARLNTSG